MILLKWKSASLIFLIKISSTIGTIVVCFKQFLPQASVETHAHLRAFCLLGVKYMSDKEFKTIDELQVAFFFQEPCSSHAERLFHLQTQKVFISCQYDIYIV